MVDRLDSLPIENENSEVEQISYKDKIILKEFFTTEQELEDENENSKPKGWSYYIKTVLVVLLVLILLFLPWLTQNVYNKFLPNSDNVQFIIKAVIAVIIIILVFFYSK